MEKKKNLKICIIRNDRMGDMILTLPIIKEIKKNVPNSTIEVVCSNINHFLCEEADFIDQVLIYENKLDIISKIKFFYKFRKKKYDYVFNFSQSLESFIFFLINNSKDKLALIYLSRYKNPKFSKTFQKVFVKLFSIENIKVDRNQFYENGINIHQTDMMYQLIKKRINIKNPKNFIMLPKINILEKNRNINRILIHLSGKWIDDKYSEKMFINLLKKLAIYGKLYLTTDNTSRQKFNIIYKNYLKINNSTFSKLFNQKDNIIILDKLNLKNWRNIIINSKLVITYECGCVHMASMSDIPIIVVYDFENKPLLINKEYGPLSHKYEKVISRQDTINKEILSKLPKHLF